MGTSVPSSLEIRTFLCAACGAPGSVSSTAADATCPCCGSPNELGPRIVAAFPSTLRPEQYPQLPGASPRLDQLRAQMQGRGRSLYDLDDVPDGLGDLDHLDARDSRAPALLAQAFLHARKALPPRVHRAAGAGGYRDHAGRTATPGSAERTLVWIASRAAALFCKRGEWTRARPWAEQALDRVTDPGLQHLSLCQLATVSRLSGDLDAAESWLSACNSEPPDLELDSAYRVACGLLLADRGKWDIVSRVIGASIDDVPASPEATVVLGLLRATAHELAGRIDPADREFARLMEVSIEQDTDELLDREPSLAPARQVVGRYREEMARRRAARRRIELRIAAIIAAVGLLVTLVSPWVVWSGRTTEMSCVRTKGQAAPSPPLCTIRRSIGGSLVETVAIPDLQQAVFNATGTGKKRSYQILLRTSSRELEMNVTRCSTCGGRLDAIAQNVNSFLKDPKRESIRVIPSDDGFLQIVGLLVGFAGLGIIGFGVLKALAALANRTAAPSE